MPGDGSGRSARRQCFLVLFILFKLIPGLAENPSPNDSTEADSHSKSISKTGLTVLLIFLGVAAILLLSFFLFKMWQKKRREEQHARLLKLFEEDNELEVELGLRIKNFIDQLVTLYEARRVRVLQPNNVSERSL